MKYFGNTLVGSYFLPYILTKYNNLTILQYNQLNTVNNLKQLMASRTSTHTMGPSRFARYFL